MDSTLIAAFVCFCRDVDVHDDPVIETTYMDDAEAADLKLLKRLTLGSLSSGKSALNVCKIESVESENV